MNTDWDLFEKIEIFEGGQTKEDNDFEKKCFSCNSKKIEFRHGEGEFVCSDCGVILCIITDKTSSQSEGQAINVYLPKSSLGTTVSGKTNSKLRIVNSWLKWVYKERIFYDDTKYIEEICYAAKLNQSIIDNALYLYKKISESNKIIRGLKRKGVMSACVYYGAQMQHQSYTLLEISTAFNIDKIYVSKGCKIIDSIVVIENKTSSGNCQEFAERYSTKLGIEEDQKLELLQIVSNIKKLQIATNFQPPTIAVASLLLLNDSGLDKKMLSSTLKISESTINKAFKTIYPWMNIITSNDLTDEYVRECLS